MARISTGIDAFEEALPTLKPDRIAGVGGLATRHDSMAAGERGADYVLFGEPDENGQRPSMRGGLPIACNGGPKLFEPPCVGFAASCEEAREFAAAGADFILVGDFIWNDPARPGGGAEGGRTDHPQSHPPMAAKSQRRTGIAPEMKPLTRPYPMLADRPDADRRARSRKSR